jgi:hypothetical protein
MAWQFNFDEVLAFINTKQEYLRTCERLFRIYNREITPFLVDRIKNDFQSENSQTEVISRMSPLNILPKIVNKLSTVNTVPAERDVKGMEMRQFSEMLTALDFDTAMQLANRYLNLFRIVAIEPVAGYDAKGEPIPNTVSKLRVYPAHKFLLMDDGTIDNNVLCFIKIIGPAKKTTTVNGKTTTNEVMVYEAYTATQYIRFDSEGIMERENPQEGESLQWITPHEFGQIPVVWASRDIVTSLPPEDTDTYNMVTLLPLMFSDLNYAVKYKCFSVLYTIDLDTPSGAIQPNSILQFNNSSKIPGEKGLLDSISPTVAVDEMLQSIYAQYSLWLESRGIKMQSMARSAGTADNQSGIAKAIDQGEVTEDVVYQRGIFANLEHHLFALLAKFQGQAYDVSTTFTEVSIMPETNTEKTDRIIKKLESNLIDWDSAVEQVNSEKNEKQIAEMKLKIMAERKLKEAQEATQSEGPQGTQTEENVSR